MELSAAVPTKFEDYIPAPLPLLDGTFGELVIIIFVKSNINCLIELVGLKRDKEDIKYDDEMVNIELKLTELYEWMKFHREYVNTRRYYLEETQHPKQQETALRRLFWLGMNKKPFFTRTDFRGDIAGKRKFTTKLPQVPNLILDRSHISMISRACAKQSKSMVYFLFIYHQ